MKSKSAGFTLIEVMIYSAVFIVIASILVAAGVYSTHIINTVEAKVNQSHLSQTMTARLQLCSLTGLPFNAGAAALPVTRYTSGQDIPVASFYSMLGVTDLKDYSLAFNDAKFLNATSLGTMASGGTAYQVEVWSRLSMLKQGIGPTDLAPYQLATMGVVVVGGAIKACSIAQTMPQVICTLEHSSDPSPGAFYLPSGYTDPTGKSYTPDSFGCIPKSAFNYYTSSPPAPRGPPAPPPPGPKLSDARVKMQIVDFKSGLADSSQTNSAEVQRMNLIRAIQIQQQELRQIQRAVENATIKH